MPNLKLTALTVALLAVAGFAPQPTFSQSTPSLPSEVQQPAPIPVQSSEHRAAAIQLYRAMDLDVSMLHEVAAEGAVESAIAGFETKAGRPLTENEYQQMFDFWYRQFQEILSQQNVEEAIATVYMRNFTLEALTEINQLEDPMVQIASPALGDEVEAAIISISSRYLTDEAWVNRIAAEMIEALPFLAEQYEPAPGIS